MKVLPVVFNPNYHINGWETSHRFPMPKYQLLYQLLVKKGFVIPGNFIRHHLLPEMLWNGFICRVISMTFWQASWTPR